MALKQQKKIFYLLFLILFQGSILSIDDTDLLMSDCLNSSYKVYC